MPSARQHPQLTALVLLIVSLGGASHGRRQSQRPAYCNTQQRERSSFLWRIETSPPSYFFGTIHVPYEQVWDSVAESVRRAFHASDAVFFELDLTDAETVAALSRCQLLPAGSRLQNLLPPPLFNRLRQHLNYVRHMMPLWMTSEQRSRGLYADYLFNSITSDWQLKRPIWVMLMVNTLTEGDVQSRGVPVLDLYLAQQASRLNKRTGAVERVEEQCHPLNGLNITQVVFALNQTLSRQERIRTGQLTPLYTTQDLIKHYNCGQLDQLTFRRDSAPIPPSMFQVLPLQPTVQVTDAGVTTPADRSAAKQIDHYFRHELIFKRNQRMGERILELIWSQPDTSFFFAFGAGHFLGNYTVLDVLRRAGYSITKVGPNEPIRRFNRRQRTFDEEGEFAPLARWDPTVLGTASTPADSHSNNQTRSSRLGNNFSDLWVRIATSERTVPSSGLDGAPPAGGDRLRAWLGPHGAASPGSCTLPSPSAQLLSALLLLVLALSPPRIHPPASSQTR